MSAREARAIHQPSQSSPVPPDEAVLTGRGSGEDDWGTGTAATVEALKTRQSAAARRVRVEVNMVLDGVGGGCRYVLCELSRARGC